MNNKKVVNERSVRSNYYESTNFDYMKSYFYKIEDE